MDEERDLILEEELLIVRHSGEIPEIAFHSSLYYLQEDPEGPGLILTSEEKEALLDGAMERAREIVLRDLEPDNRDLGLYRGVRRTIYNWHRYLDFCRRTGRQGAGFRVDVQEALHRFLIRELEDVRQGQRASCINCTAAELARFIRELGMDPAELPRGWEMLCPDREPGR